jgi:hypothetical protein
MRVVVEDCPGPVVAKAYSALSAAGFTRFSRDLDTLTATSPVEPPIDPAAVRAVKLAVMSMGLKVRLIDAKPRSRRGPPPAAAARLGV